MRRPHSWIVAGLAAGLFAYALWGSGAGGRARARERPATGAVDPERSAEVRRQPAQARPAGPETGPAPEAPAAPPGDPAALEEWVAALRAMDRAELERASHAAFRFRDSELVGVLLRLEGDWVVGALGALAIAERDPLLEAILVHGLCRGARPERAADPRMLPLVEALLERHRRIDEDPYEVAQDALYAARRAWLAQGVDPVARLAPVLDASDNPQLLVTGYLLLGRVPGASGALAAALAEHDDPDARMGAIEGLRAAARAGELDPGHATVLFAAALAREEEPRNRDILYEALAATGGEPGAELLREVARGDDPGAAAAALAVLGERGDGAEALALFEELDAERLDAAARAELLGALARIPGDAAGAVLGTRALDPALPAVERVAALEGLRGREIDAELGARLDELVLGAADGSVRAKALQLRRHAGAADSLDLRSLASADPDPLVRAEAVRQVAFEDADDARAFWIERLATDPSDAVRGAALTALGSDARAGGGVDDVLAWLDGARSASGDPAFAARIEAAKARAREWDPLRLGLELEHEARLQRRLARRLDGPAAVEARREAEQLERRMARLRRAARD